NVERAVDHDLLALARVFLTPRPANRGLMEYELGAFDVGADRVALSDIDFHEPGSAGRESGRDVAAVAAQEQVHRDDFLCAAREGRVDEVRPDGSRATGDDDASTRDAAHEVCAGSLR